MIKQILFTCFLIISFEGSTQTITDIDGNKQVAMAIRCVNNQTVSNENAEDLKTFKVYPNPFNESIKIEMETIIQEISIIDLKGRILINQIEKENSSVNLDVSQLSTGFYFIRITDSQGKTHIQKITKK